MNSFFNVLRGMLFLQKGPQDFPCSIILMRLCLAVYFISGLPGLMSSLAFGPAIFAMALDTIVLLLFVYACLQAFSKAERFVQSVISLASIGTVFQLLVLPLLYNFNPDPAAVKDMFPLSLLILGFVGWKLSVYAHVFKEAFSVRLPAAMILTICYTVITMLSRKLFFPELT